jgi:hypothetical protein
MAKTYRFAAYGWTSLEAFTPTVLIGRYRTRLFARLGAWWFEASNRNAHAWVREEHHIVLVENGRRV